MTVVPARPLRLAYLVSHPIHYQAPLLRMIAAQPDIDLTVFFQSDYLLRPTVDPDYGVTIDWETDLIGGFNSVFLPRIGSGNQFSFFRPWTYGLWRRLVAGRFDALWVHGYARFDNILAMMMGRVLGLRILVRDEVTQDSKARGPIRSGLKRLFFQFLRGLCDGFTVIGTRNAAYYRQNGIPDQRMFLVPYAVDNAFFQNRSAAAGRQSPDLRRELGLDMNVPVILFVARLLELKRPDTLLAAYARIAGGAEAEQPYLVFVGDGPMHESLAAEAARLGLNRVRFAGFEGQLRLPAYYAMADVFVLPSEWEPWGLVVNEAMSCGVPVIVSDRVGCQTDLVRDGDTGLVVPTGDIDALAAALRRLLTDRTAAATMGEAGRALIDRWDYAADLRGLRQALGVPDPLPAP
ncbi:glycosyltransferase involved in cell wall biosynthesis [Azospirillum fermentarium]|uniref:glycosyltransferase family 4 protein n=1 Tax=Azospirillum fermentarium TaxID=1233114 RepID=UPI00222632B0|nr:glycosyltransferase family 4 protein [Azospirillum fermentarium]MCW2249607.1 glycosyltransferase involved in cell wall biosynthesis [Azospirillum fermentarium]